MTREPLERLLENVTDEDLEQLRDAILREEGRRRTQYRLMIRAPHPPLPPEDLGDSIGSRWAKLLAWLAKDQSIPLATNKRAVSIRLTTTDTAYDAHQSGILLQEALVEAGLLLGRTPEWMDATTTQAEPGEIDTVWIELWDKPGFEMPWSGPPPRP